MQALIRVIFFIVVVKPILAIIVGVNVFGKKNLEAVTPLIIVANHNSHLDALALMNLFPLFQLHRVSPVAAEDYFMENPLLAWFSKTCINIIPIPRKRFTKLNNPITRMAGALDAGSSLIIFPEGSRGEPETMGEFKAGIGHLVEKHPHIPVVPVYLKGMGRSLPKGEWLLVPFFCDVIIGAPRQYCGTREEIVKSIEQDVLSLQALL